MSYPDTRRSSSTWRMAYSSSYSSNPFGSMLTRWVRWLLIANCAVFLVDLLLRLTIDFRIAEFFWFRPVDALSRPWTILTYMFVHGDFFHLLMNMLGLLDRPDSGTYLLLQAAPSLPPDSLAAPPARRCAR